MSLETLLEAARYLDKVEQKSPSFIITNDPTISASGSSPTLESPVVGGGHLLIDPNLPISCQFHTYSSSSAPGKGISFTVDGGNRSTKKIIISHNNGRNDSTNNAGNNMVIITPGVPIGLSNLSVSPTQQSSLSSSLSSNNSSSSYRGRAMSSGSNSSGKGHPNRGTRYHGDSNSDKDSLASSRHREMHKTSEKNRRAHLRECFEQLKKELPQPEYRDRKSSHINIIHCALRYIQCLRRIEAEHESEMARLARAKIRHQNTIVQLKQDLDSYHIDMDKILQEVADSVIGSNNDAALSISRSDYDQYQSDGEVIVELEADQYYDDETTTTASECADDTRTEALSSNSSFNSVKSPSSLLNQCHA